LQSTEKTIIRHAREWAKPFGHEFDQRLISAGRWRPIRIEGLGQFSYIPTRSRRTNHDKRARLRTGPVERTIARRCGEQRRPRSQVFGEVTMFSKTFLITGVQERCKDGCGRNESGGRKAQRHAMKKSSVFGIPCLEESCLPELPFHPPHRKIQDWKNAVEPDEIDVHLAS